MERRLVPIPLPVVQLPPTTVQTTPTVTITSPRVQSPRQPWRIQAIPIVAGKTMVVPPPPIVGGKTIVVPPPPIVGGKTIVVPPPPIVGGKTIVVPPPPIVGGKTIVVPPPPIVGGKTIVVPPPPVVGGKTIVVPPPPIVGGKTVVVPPPPIKPTTYNPIENEIRAVMAQQSFEPYTAVWKSQDYPGYYVGNVRSDNVKEVLTQYTKYKRYYYNGSDFVMEYLMSTGVEHLDPFITALGFGGLNDTVDVKYNLMWYINAAPDPYATGLTKEHTQYLASLTPAHIQSILGPRYQGPTDKASLLFAAISGKSTDRPDIKDIPRYPRVATYVPEVVWSLAQASGIFGRNDDTGLRYVSSYAPYVHVALQPPSPQDDIASQITYGNISEMIQRYGVGLPGHIDDDPHNKVQWFVTNLDQYPDTFIRPPNMPPPPSIKNMLFDDIVEALSFYTNQELLDAYEPQEMWRNRTSLLVALADEAEVKNPKWTWRNRHCNNDDTFNVMYGDLHGDINKDDADDPTLSYGVQGNYRCYQASELAASFRDDENGIFHFTVPDWVNEATVRLMGGTNIDPTTGQPLIREFSVASMKSLKRLLQNLPVKYAKSTEIPNLLTSITNGLNKLAGTNAQMQRLHEAYVAMNPTQQYLVRVYLAWLFLFAMWMRFWRGPPNPYPTRWVEDGGYGAGELCDTNRRDEHVILQLSLRTAIIEAYEKDPILEPFINNLPLVNYNFANGEAAVAEPGEDHPYRVNDIVEPLQRGKFCEAHGSDLILKSSYYLAVKILGLTTGQQFNAFLAEMYPFLKDLEKQVVNYKLEHVQDRDKVRGKVSMLEARQNQLKQDAPLPIFDPTGVTKTGHMDPNLGWDIKFNTD